MRKEIVIDENTKWEDRNLNWIDKEFRNVVKSVEVARYKCSNRPWELTEIRVFGIDGKYLNACLLVKDLDTGKDIEGIEDVWIYSWEDIKE